MGRAPPVHDNGAGGCLPCRGGRVSFSDRCWIPNPVRLASNMVGATGARQLLQDADASATEGVDAAAGNIASDA